MKLNHMICNEHNSLLEALRSINENMKSTVFIVDDASKLVGVITDGDIRRALLAGKGLETTLGEIIGGGFVYGHIADSIDTLKGKINEKIKIIPLVDEKHQVVDFFEYHAHLHVPVSFPYLKGNELKYLTDAFLSTWISSSGKYIDLFESAFAEFVNSSYAVSVSNGTVAIQLALKALGIGEGDEVIVPDLTFAATINAVLHVNATPVIVDIEPDSWCIDPKQISQAITKRTKAIIPVHLYGQVCDMDAIMQIAEQNQLFVIEDCAESHGALYKGRKTGSIGDIGCFSFFANKIVTTGEGGMCVTSNEKLQTRLRLLRDHGMSKNKKYWHEEVGFNFRMTNLQASLGYAQMEKVNQMLVERKQIEDMYKHYLKENHAISFQSDLPDRDRVVWLVSILVPAAVREQLLLRLRNSGFDNRAFFYPLSAMNIYKSYTHSNAQSRLISEQGLNLPTYIGISEEHVVKITNQINMAVGKIK
ncbi:perosamine synthetase [Cohnella sp. OV330]|uniref:aminotransferase class I/II-fold pyridoxal phosphate-dependent enzyme n=1 Tax=Cohnella sp. OV330 TaxID=1855288 RepID=UPI0008EFC38C|nr:aminotransferase class I/II-fold pyridoxal phosphate-dependent enzyme [Cohnella sp. OV330]SFB47861.1 perosamine synthetase [Cohnella sp. OV330]